MPDRLSTDLPTVMWRVIAPELPQPRWYEDEGLLLEDLTQMDFASGDAVIHRLTLDVPVSGRYVWTLYAYQAPPGRGRLVPADKSRR